MCDKTKAATQARLFELLGFKSALDLSDKNAVIDLTHNIVQISNANRRLLKRRWMEKSGTFRGGIHARTF